MSEQLTEKYKTLINDKHGNTLDLSKFEFITVRTPSIIICNTHGEFKISPKNAARNKTLCPKCRIHYNQRFDNNSFIQACKNKHKDRFIYTDTVFIDWKTKIKVSCKVHGDFITNPYTHLHKFGGCSPCSIIENNKNSRLSQEEFILRANQVHNEKYDYSKSSYTTAKNKLTITCPTHGDFEQKAYSHLSGCGCPECGNIKIGRKLAFSDEKYKSIAKRRHNSYYDYSKTTFYNMKSKIIVICPEHGEFNVSPEYHLSSENGGCNLCKNNTIESQWLTYVGVPESSDYRQVKIKFSDNTYIYADGYDKDTNTIYEFWGDYWHGHPDFFNSDDINMSNKTLFGELYKNTLLKIKKIKANGYKLVDCWEHEFRKILLENNKKGI